MLAAVLKRRNEADPSFNRTQRENVWKHFRFTNRTARLSLLWGVLVPVGVFAICQRQDVRLSRSSLDGSDAAPLLTHSLLSLALCTSSRPHGHPFGYSSSGTSLEPSGTRQLLDGVNTLCRRASERQLLHQRRTRSRGKRGGGGSSQCNIRRVRFPASSNGAETEKGETSALGEGADDARWICYYRVAGMSCEMFQCVKPC